jgi:hypothetical protein
VANVQRAWDDFIRHQPTGAEDGRGWGERADAQRVKKIRLNAFLDGAICPLSARGTSDKPINRANTACQLAC